MKGPAGIYDAETATGPAMSHAALAQGLRRWAEPVKAETETRSMLEASQKLPCREAFP